MFPAIRIVLLHCSTFCTFIRQHVVIGLNRNVPVELSLSATVADNLYHDNLRNVASLFAITDPNQAANNNHVNSVSEGLPESGTKTFYENLPFHGIQAPPNKVSVTMIVQKAAPFVGYRMN